MSEPSRSIAQPFTDAADFQLSFDAVGRLRIGLPPRLRPLAAWLAGDAQADPTTIDDFCAVVAEAEAAADPAGRVLHSNGCSLTFSADGTASLESLHERWPALVLETFDVLSALGTMRAFLLAHADDRPPHVHDHGCYRALVGFAETGDGPRVERTFFPDSWTREQVVAAANQARSGPEFVIDPGTGYWSGVADGLEVAGYADLWQGTVLDFFPVLAGRS